MTPDDRYRQVAALHAANINQGFLATLGIAFLAVMYRAIDEATGSVLITEERGGRVIGFVAGGMGMGAIYTQMLRHPKAWLALFPSLLQPRKLGRILEILRYSGVSSSTAELPRAELFSIAVDHSSRGTGVAERLYRKLQVHFSECGVYAFRITVGTSLTPAHRFYKKMGAEPVGHIEVHAGASSIVYVQRFSGPCSAA